MNPYESPQQIEPSVARSPLVVRVAWILPGAVLGLLLGRAGSWFVWQFIYSIGSRVISDALYSELESTVCLAGTVVGAVSGAAVGLLTGPRSLICIPAQHVAGVVCGMIGSNWGWQPGLLAYFVGQLLGVLAVWGVSATMRPDNRG